MTEIDIKRYERQQSYLIYLKAMKLAVLTKRHKTVFKDSKWEAKELPNKIPGKIRRAFYTRRLWVLFAAKHYHFPKGTSPYKEFMRTAKSVLTDKLAKSHATLDKKIAAEIRDYSRFDKKTIMALSEKHLEQILSYLGINFKRGIKVGQKRKALWEYYHMSTTKTIPERPSRSSSNITAQRKGAKIMVTGRPRNSASMKDTILSDCALTFDQFVKRYGKKFPHITPGSYSVCRSILRLDGFADVISFPRGRAVVKPKPKKRTKKKTKKKSRR